MPSLTLLNPRTSLRARIALAIGGVAVLVALLVGYSVDYLVSKNLTVATKSRLGSVAHEISSEIDRDLYERKRDIGGLVAEDILQSPRVSAERKRRLLDDIHAAYPDYAWIGILDTSGQVVAGTNGDLEGYDASKRPIFLQGRASPFVGDVHPDQELSTLVGNKPGKVLRLIDIAIPMYDAGGHFRGVVCAYLNWDWVRSVVTTLQQAGEAPANCSIAIESQSGIVSRIDTPLSNITQSGSDAQIFDLNDTDHFVYGVKKSMGYRDFPGLGWTTIVRQNRAVALEPARQTHLLIVGCGLLISVLSIIVAWLLAGEITKPLVATTSAADALHRGESTENIPEIKGSDELARLSASLRTLIGGLKTSDERHRSLLDTSLEAICILGLDEKISYANQALADASGYTLEDLMQMTIYDLFFEDEIDSLRRRRQERREGISEQYETRIKHKSGRVLWALCSASPFHDEQSTYAGTFVVLIDITKRKLAEIALSASLRREVLLNEIAQCLRESADPLDIENSAVRLLGEAIGAERCIFMIADPTTKLIKVESQWYREGLKPFPDSFDFGRMNLTAEGLFPYRQTLVVRDVAERSLSREMDMTLSRYNLHSLVIVPLYDRESLVAGLAVYRKEAQYDWAQDEVELIELVAAQVRTAVNAARTAYREHRIATVLQNALQPVNPQDVPGVDLATYYKPALDEASIGGDFFDVFKIEDDVWALVIADVSGKGLTAAVQVTTVRNMLRYVLYEGTSPDHASVRLNQVFYKYRLLTGFVTLFVALYNVRDRRIQFSSCGHEPMLFLRHGDNSMFELEATGPPLGVDPDSEYECGTFEVKDGDCLVLYTDGLSEAGPDRTHLLGTDGLAAILAEYGPNCASAQAMRNRIMKGVSDHAQGILRDDTCLIVAIFK